MLKQLLLKNFKGVKFNLEMHLLLIFIFANLYYFLAPYSNEVDKKEFGRSWEGDLYYSLITQFTVGIGDIAPTSTILRRLTMLQVILAFIFI